MCDIKMDLYMNLQIATLYWELRGMPGVAATPEPLLAPQCWYSWPRLSMKWSRMVRNKNKMLYKQQLVGLGTLDCKKYHGVIIWYACRL